MKICHLAIVVVVVFSAYIAYKLFRFFLVLHPNKKFGKYILYPQGKFWWIERINSRKPNFYIITNSEIYSVKLLTFYAPWHNAVVFDNEGNYRKVHLLENKNKKKKRSVREVNYREGLPLKYYSKKVIPVVLFYPAPKIIFLENMGKRAIVTNGDKIGNCLFLSLRKLKLLAEGGAYE